MQQQPVLLSDEKCLYSQLYNLKDKFQFWYVRNVVTSMSLIWSPGIFIQDVADDVLQVFVWKVDSSAFFFSI